jgi:PAS domain S-box-containing protein
LAGTSVKDHKILPLAGFGDSNRFLIVSLSLIILLILLGRAYLFFQYRAEVADAVAGLVESSSRNVLIVSTYQLALNSYDLAEHAVADPGNLFTLRRSYIQKKDSLRAERDRYVALEQQIREKPVELTSTVNHFFSCVDTLLAQTDRVFDGKRSPSGRLELSGMAAGMFKPSINEYFRRLRLDWQAMTELERTVRIKEVTQEEHLIRVSAFRWFGLSTVLIILALSLTAIILMNAWRATSLLRQLSAVLEHNVNPIQVASPSGEILYVNSEFERWSGLRKPDLVGTNWLKGLQLADGQGHRQSAWNALQSSVQRGETWTGEVVDGQHQGVPFSLIVMPVFDQKGRLRQVIGLHHDASERERLARAVEQSRKQYQILIESSRDGIVVLQHGKLAYVNPAAVRIFQYDSQEDLKRQTFIDTVAPPSRPFVNVDYLHRPAGEEILKNYEIKGLTKQGKLIDLEIDARVIVWNEGPALHVSYRDISERKSLERQQAVWLWEQETLSSIDRQLLGIIDLHKVLDTILQQVMLLTRSQFVGVAMIDIENRQGHWRAAMGNRSSLVGSSIAVTSNLVSGLTSREYLVLEDRRSGGLFSFADLPALEAEEIVSAGFFPLVTNPELRGRLVVGYRQPHKFAEREIRVLVSMAEKVSIALSSGELYENLLKREKELELLSGARVQAQEEERRRISREIHDGLGQLLTAIKLNLEILEDSLPVQDDAGKRIGEVKQLLDNVLKEAREISYNLMPSVLDDFGLGPGLQSLCEQFSKRMGVKVSFHEHGLKERLSPDVEIGLYRIVQEALNNVTKHAEAKEVDVQLVRHANRLRMTIEDDGKGMEAGLPARKPSGSGGTGLVSMRERAASFGGTFVIDSTPGKGTLINIEIPMNAS